MKHSEQTAKHVRILHALLRSRRLFCKQLVAAAVESIAAAVESRKITQAKRTMIEKVVASDEIYEIAMLYWLGVVSPHIITRTIAEWINDPLSTRTTALLEDGPGGKTAFPVKVILRMLERSGGASHQTYRTRLRQLETWGLLVERSTAPPDEEKSPDSKKATAKKHRGDLVYESTSKLEVVFGNHLAAMSRRLDLMEKRR